MSGDPTGSPMIDPAFVLAAEVGSSLYDGLFLALAIQLGGQLVTADEKLFTKIQVVHTPPTFAGSRSAPRAACGPTPQRPWAFRPP